MPRRIHTAGAVCLAAGAYWAFELSCLAWSHYNGRQAHGVWPAVLLAAAIVASVGQGLQILQRSAQDEVKSVRRPPGKVVVVDNRSMTGMAVVGLSVVQATLFAAWWCVAEDRDLRLLVQAQASVFAAVSAIAYL
ncbi:hypothetical protein GGH20_005359, partial [Coemansia sp. RSA 1937]